MAVVMTIGMVAAVTVFMYGLNIFVERIAWEEVLTNYPAHALVAVAIGMSAPMIPWMRWRGHARKDAYEMAVLMGALAIPFICLALLDVVDGAQCGLYCIAGYVGMLGLMVIRRHRFMGRGRGFLGSADRGRSEV
jgi:hypothetical protein